MTIPAEVEMTAGFPTHYDDWVRAIKVACDVISALLAEVFEALSSMMRALLRDLRLPGGVDIDTVLDELVAKIRRLHGVDVRQFEVEHRRRSRQGTMAPRTARLTSSHRERWSISLRAYARR